MSPYTVSDPFRKNEKSRCYRFAVAILEIWLWNTPRRYIMPYAVRPAKEKLRIVLEGMKAENISALCRREGISPTDYYRYRDKLVEGGLEALRQNGRQKRDAEKESLKKEIEKLKEIIVSQAGEMELLKKKTSSDW